MDRRRSCPDTHFAGTVRSTAGLGLLLLMAVAALSSPALALPAARGPLPPEAPQVPWADTLHGDVRLDPYRWLREKESPRVRAYLEAENAYTDTLLAHTRPLQDSLYREMVGRIKETDIEVPYLKDGWYYYTRTEKALQYPIYCRKKGSVDAPEQVVIDVNQLAEGKPYMDLGAYTVSDDGNLLAYSTDETGFRQYSLQVKDLTAGAVTPVIAEKTGAVAWAADNRTLFYTVEDEAKRQYRLYRHVLGSESHELVYEEPDQSFSVGVYRGRSRAFLYLLQGSLTTSEVRFLPAGEPTGTWRMIEPRRPEIRYSVEDDRETFTITVNDTGRNFRLVTVPVATPGKEHWTEVLPVRDDVMLEGMDVFDRWSVRYERADGLPRLIVIDRTTGESWPVAFPEPTYTFFPSRNAEFETPSFRYEYTSMVTPRSTYEYEFPSRTSVLLKRQEVLGGYDPAGYRSERIYATASDGTQIPISLVYRLGVRLDGTAPCLLEGYGAYGIPIDPFFSSARLSLLDRGVIFALAHVRGGGEMGKPWHDAGRMLNKMNTFTDFIACAEHLVETRYTSRDRLVAEGGSAGGLLMGVIVNQRPDLFRAIVLEVPFVDLINTMADASLPLTVGEYEEWGNPAIEEQYRYMRQYSPYDNLARRAYPAILVRTSLNDSQVMYWEPAKYVARLRTLKMNADTPLLLKIQMTEGHGGASGRYDFLREMSFVFAFILDQLGIRE